MDKDTRVTMSEEKYNFLKNCAKNLRKIDAILNSKESEKAKESVKGLEDSKFWEDVIIPIHTYAHIFIRMDYTYYSDNY
jgi:hypothetical protein